MKKGQTSKRNGIQDILFPMQYMNITQGNNEQVSHIGVNALDLAGKDTDRDLFFAPFDVICITTGDKNVEGNAVFWQSQNKVRYADGSIDYATIMVLHDDNLNGIYEGVKYTQGTQIAQEGTAGNATGNHNHFEIAKGKFTHKYDMNSYGIYHLPNSISADKCCFIDNTTIINDKKMKWKYLSDVPVKPEEDQITKGEILNSIPKDFISEHAFFTCMVDKLMIRRAPSLKGSLTGDWYKKGMSFEYEGYVKRENYIWVSYIGKDKTRRWVAVREVNTNKPYGIFK